MLRRLIIAASLVAAYPMAFAVTALTDYNCVNQCLQQGIMYSVCIKRCSD